jgi:Vitamin B12 dependent methionine synthase, activation domain
MITKTLNIDFKDLKLSSSMLESVLGYKEGDDREYVKSLIEETLVELQGISNIKAQFIVFNEVRFEADTKTVEINKIKFQVEKIVFGQVKKADSVAVFLCTAGEEIGVCSRNAMKDRDFLKGYIFDIVGTEIVEAAADLMQGDLEKNMRDSGKKITNRYSPGYCGWDVTEQHKLFQLMPENHCGIKLTPSALMDPVKSISGIIGIGENVKNNPYTCRLCNQNDCVYRSIKERMKQKV